MTKKNILAARIQPWQLFRFKKFIEWSKKKPGVVIQEALQIYFSSINIPEKTLNQWIDEYHSETGDAE